VAGELEVDTGRRCPVDELGLVRQEQDHAKATEAGFEVGTRTTIDVLQTRRQLFQAQTNYYRSRYDYIVAVLQLKYAAGSLSVEDLQEVNGWLVH